MFNTSVVETIPDTSYPNSGRPSPSVSWSKSPLGENLASRAIVDTHEAASKLLIEKTDRYDAGKYTITVENASGVKEAHINVKVYGERARSIVNHDHEPLV